MQITNDAKWKIVLPNGAWYEVDAGNISVENFFSNAPSTDVSGGGALRPSGMAITAHIPQPFTPLEGVERSRPPFNVAPNPAAE